MTTQIYHLGRGTKLVPVTTSDNVIGQRVTQAHKGRIGVITDKANIGYTVTFDDGSQSTGQQFDCLSPFTRISSEPGGFVSADEVEQLKALAVKFRANQIAAAKTAEVRHAQEKEQYIAELRAKYPKAKAGQSSYNLRAELKAAFPKTKFSVRLDGNSIDVRWTDGASEEAVKAICAKYTSGNFDGMDDSFKYDSSAYGRAVEAVLGRVNYVFTHRHYTPAAMQDAVDALSARFGWRNEITVKTSNYDGHAYTQGEEHHQRGEIYGLLNSTDLQF